MGDCDGVSEPVPLPVELPVPLTVRELDGVRELERVRDAVMDGVGLPVGETVGVSLWEEPGLKVDVVLPVHDGVPLGVRDPLPLVVALRLRVELLLVVGLPEGVPEAEGVGDCVPLLDGVGCSPEPAGVPEAVGEPLGVAL